VVKDLVPDLTNFYAQYASIEPWLHTRRRRRKKNGRQSHDERTKLDGLYECILCACLLDLMPELLVEFRPRFLGPAVLLQAKRWLDDSRDEANRRAAR